MKKYLSIPFVVECVLDPKGSDTSYVIVRDPDGKVISVNDDLIDASSFIYDFLDEYVFSKNKKDENS